MDAALLFDIMAQNNNSNGGDDVKLTILHDFLGGGCAPVTKFATATDVAGGSSPSASVSGGGGGGAGPVSTTSDLGSERQVGAHVEGVPFFGQKIDFSGSKNRYSGSKRSNSDSVFMAPSRDGILQMRPDFAETSHLMKMLRNVRPHDDETFMGVHQIRPTSSSLRVPPATGGKTNANTSKWERAIPVNVGPVLQYPPRAAQVSPYGYQAVSNRFKDSNVGSSVISQLAADEGSRTGIKGSGILSSVNVGAGTTEPISGKRKSLTSNLEPSSSAPIHSRQMTIFYGGQAHVFDDVHPNKADVIMALAGSIGGSWSTSFSSNSTVNDRMPMLPGEGKGSLLTKDARAVAEQNAAEKE